MKFEKKNIDFTMCIFLLSSDFIFCSENLNIVLLPHGATVSRFAMNNTGVLMEVKSLKFSILYRLFDFAKKNHLGRSC